VKEGMKMRKMIVSLMVGLIVVLSGCSSNDEYEPNIENYLGTPNVNVKDSEIFYSMVGGEETIGESYSSYVENVFVNANSFSVSTFSVDVDTASYSNIRRMLMGDSLPYKDAVRIEEMINYFDYDLVGPNDDEVIGITTELAPSPWNENHDLLMVGLKTEEIDFSDAPANNLVFLLDVSGSMNNADKLPLLQSAMKLLVGELRAIDKISIVVYAGAAGVVLDGADGGDQEQILEAIDSLSAGGSTAGGAGINLAYNVALENYIEGGNNRVILATDGDFNVGVSSESGLEDLIVSKRDDGVFLSVLGFGTGNLKDSKMETLADKGNGVFYYIDSLLEAKKVFVNELGGSLITVAKDVKLQIEFNPATVKGYRLIGYENRLLDYEDFDDDTKDAGDMGAGHEVIAFYEIIPTSSGEVVDEHEFDIPDELKYTGDNYTDEIMTLSIRYKEPQYDTSQLIQHVVYVAEKTTTPSNTFVFASCVTEFGLILRESEYTYNASYTSIINRAALALGTDEHGYRAEFITLVEKALSLSDIE